MPEVYGLSVKDQEKCYNTPWIVGDHVNGFGWIALCGTRETFMGEIKKAKRLVLLNAVVPFDGLVVMGKEHYEVVQEVLRVRKPDVCFIGHPQTAEVVSDLAGYVIKCERGTYTPRAGDVAIVVRLTKRLPRGVSEVEVKPEDLEYWVVWYVE